MSLLYPSIGEPTAEDEKIWKQLEDLVKQKQDGANNANAKSTLLTFLKLEKGKRNYRDQNENMNTATDIRIVPQDTSPAIAPFVVPSRINFDIAPKKNAYYNFAIKKAIFNGKVKSDNAEETTFYKNTITLLTQNGNYESTYDNTKIAEIKKTDKRTGQRVSIFKLDKNGDVVVHRLQIKNIVPDEVLKKYVQYRTLIDELFELDPNENYYDSRFADAMNKLNVLFQDARLSVNGTEWRKAHLKLDRKEALKETALQERLKNCRDQFGEQFKGQYSNTMLYNINELVYFQRKIYKSLVKNNKGALKNKKLDSQKWMRYTTGVMTQEQRKYDLNIIDKTRIDLDARLWSRYDRQAQEHRRDEPSIYDLFEILKIDETLELEQALRTAVLRLQNRKKEKAFSWEKNGYTFYRKEKE